MKTRTLRSWVPPEPDPRYVPPAPRFPPAPTPPPEVPPPQEPPSPDVDRPPPKPVDPQGGLRLSH